MSPAYFKHVFIGLGSNIEPRSEYINRAIQRISEKHILEAQADFIETEPWGFEADTNFLNTVILISTTFNPRELILDLQAIELELGRKIKSANNTYSSRTIDLDLLFFGDEILVSPDLELPHPEIANRTFVLEPLNQIAPNFRDPLCLKTVNELYLALVNSSL